MNISFTKLGNDECEKCEIFANHNVLHTKTSLSADCLTCNKWLDHKKMADSARILYDSHRQKSSCEVDCVYYSADLQKVIMLPWMPSFKSAMFTRRTIAFNKSLIPLQSTKGPNRPFVVLWSEPVAGRKKEEIISTFHHFLLHCHDKKKL